MDYFNNFILLDASKMETLFSNAKTINCEFENLYRGSSEVELEEVAPYLFTFQVNSGFSNWIFENGWCNSWGVIVSTKIDFEGCWKHFRKFLIVKTEEDQELYFRFYDPRVLKIFLPTCDENQIKEFFGPIESFIVEGYAKEEAIRFWHQKGELKQEILPVEKVFGKTIAIANESTE